MRLGTFPQSSDTPLPLWPPLLATRGAGGKSDRHKHHAMHVILAIDGRLHVRAPEAVEQSTFGVVTAPDMPHAVDARGVEVLLVFLDPESTAGAALLPAMCGATRCLSASERDALLVDATPRAIMTANFGEPWVRRVVSVLGGNALPQRASVHPKVKRALNILRQTNPGDEPSLESLARSVGLSPGRFMHAFTESLGVPLRPYLLWLKVQRAAGAIVRGEPLAVAAVGAGFADAAHMSRTFRRMFGVTPSELRKVPGGLKPSA